MCIEKLGPPCQPGRIRARPLDRGKRRREKELPVGHGHVKRYCLLAAGFAENKGVLVDLGEGVFVGWQSLLEGLDVGLLLVDGIAAASQS